MRLIDADAFKDYIRGVCEEMKHLYKDNGAWAKEITESFCKDIDEQPTIQPEPCEDAVNRETILKFFDGWMSVLDENCHNQSVSDLKIIKRDFANLPSVTPKQRTGK